MRTIQQAEIKSRTVLVRVDFNVPLKDGKVVDDLRIRACLPTLQYLREQGAAKIILISHLGRPEGKDKTLSLQPVSQELGKLIDGVKFVDEISGPKVEQAVSPLKKGEILVLENLRFYPGETENSTVFAREIVDSAGAEVFVQDGFAVAHRAHASTSAITDCLPSYAGLLLEKEVKNLEKALRQPKHPVLLIIGGAKVDDKAPLIENFKNIADDIFVGGKIAADNLIKNSHKTYVAEDFDEDGEGQKLDVGPVATVKLAEKITEAQTIIWNGLLGKAEDPAYATSSEIAAQLIGEKTGTETIICGGDTAAFVENYQKQHPKLKYSLISTGGGAALEFLAGNELPGIKVLK